MEVSWHFLLALCTRIALSSFAYEKNLALPGGLSLGSQCRSSLQCLLHLHHSHCAGGICACLPHHVPLNDTFCLPASLLGYGCATDAQCQMKVQNSECAPDTHLCQCAQGFLPLRKDKCLPPAKIGDYCLSDTQCHLAENLSYCEFIVPRIYGKCQCPLVGRGGKCVPRIGDKCSSDDECSRGTPGSECLRSECRCSEGRRLTEDLMCEPQVPPKSAGGVSRVRPVSLGKPCLSDVECWIRDRHSQCVEGRCECVRDTPHCSSFNTGCLNDTFQCTSGQCISWYFVCDGEKNCADGSDEDTCTPFACPSSAFQCTDGTCLSRSAVCNGRWECPDGSDEATCYTGIPCDRHSFRCANGQCLPPYVFCNAVVDCYDGSDEDFAACERGDSCPDTSFRCRNSRCRSTAILCSGLDGCGDNSDEDRCSVCACAAPE